jgi:CheY-like chemotaxis protein
VKADNKDENQEVNFLDGKDKVALKSTKKYKILVISENSLDIYMIKKYLPKEQGYNILEASSLANALKILNYITLDLIIIDDIIHGKDDGYAILKKLSTMQIIKDIPKMLLLTKGYEDRDLPSYNRDFDYVKKPLDGIVFKHRTQLLIDNSKEVSAKKSYFKQLSYQKFLEASSYLGVYHDIFEMDEGMSLIYDRDLNTFVESNSAFENFFTNIRVFNRIVFNKKLVKEYLPYIDESNYINHYKSDEMMDAIIKNLEFNFSLKVKLSFNEYSFSVVAKKIELKGRDLYLIKLINILDYLPKSDSEVRSANITLKESNLASFKDEFLKLRSNLQKSQLNNKEHIDKLVYQLSSKLSILCDDSSIIDDYKVINKENIYALISKNLKDYDSKYSITLNSKKIDENFDENSEVIYSKVDEKNITLFVKLLLDCYANSDIDMLLYESSETIIMELAFDEANMKEDEILIKDLTFATKELDATLERVKESKKVIIIVNLPKN